MQTVRLRGNYTDTSQSHHGFLLTASGFTSIDCPGAIVTGASAISNSGNIVGF